MAPDLSRIQRSGLDAAIRHATAVQQTGNRQAAAAAWENAATQAENFAYSASTESERCRRQQTAAKLKSLAGQLATLSATAAANESVNPSGDEFRQLASQLVHRSTVRFQDIAGLANTTNEILQAYAQSQAIAPQDVAIPGMQNLLFYGPAGCGKTLLAAAVSNSLNTTFFCVKASDLLSRYYGDSPKLVKALYDEARSRGSSAIFLDEVDGLAGSRGSGDSSADRRLLTSLLTELDGLAEKDGGSRVVTIAATNRPWDLEEAFLSRFQQHIYIPLPDSDARVHLVQLHLKGHQISVQESDLLRQTKGLSGREIAHLCNLMIQSMLKEANPEMIAVAQQGPEAIAGYTLKLAAITPEHLRRSRVTIQPRTSSESLELFHRWAAQQTS